MQKISFQQSLKDIPQNIVAAVKRPQVWGFFVSLAVIAVLALAFFYPDASLGNQLRQHDMQQGAAIGQEVKAYVEATGAEQPRWTNSLFSGMPTFQISPTYPSNNLFKWITTVYGAGLPSPSNLLFMMMAGFVILMACLKVRWYYGLIGAIAWGFSTYFIIIIGAGHIWKFVTLAYIPPTIGGIILAYRGRWFTGSALAALFAMMQIESNHVQMTYYFAILIGCLAVAYLVQSIRKREFRRWLTATLALVVAALLAVGANLPSLYNTYKYAKETMRGSHTELTAAASDADAANRTGGLDRDYITQYSYGRSESLSLLIPNIKGGASAKPVGGQLQRTSVLDDDKAREKAANWNLNDGEMQFVSNYVSQYFGEPEGTNGPVYVGAIIVALFLFGCVVVRGPLKWTLLALTVLSLLLALGRNCMWLTDWFIDYFPMYSKFRTVESILVVAEFTMPVLAILGLQKLLTADDPKKYAPALYWCFGIPALICALGWLFPSIYGPAISQGDEQLSQMLGYQLLQAGYPPEAVQMFSIHNPTIAALVQTLRYDMVAADSLRSLIFILLGFGALMICVRQHLRPAYGAALIGIMIVADLFTVNKRYLDHDSFCTPQVSASNPFPMSEADRAILADTTMHYRVMDIPGFYQAAPSYYHKAIGGYHAAKLTRYQDLIDCHLSNIVQGRPFQADFRVLDMLNAKYVIDQNGRPTVNPEALGNAWFVSALEYVDTPDAEMAALDRIDPATVAVADRKFAPIFGERINPVAPGDTIFLTSYAPDRLTYAANTQAGALAVFSEVYFPWGWEATVDGKPVEIGRVNYLLRAIPVPAGKHAVEMVFRPASVTATVGIAKAAVILIYVLLFAALMRSLCCPKCNGSRKSEN